jgi:hypothetical protein
MQRHGISRRSIALRFLLRPAMRFAESGNSIAQCDLFRRQLEVHGNSR